MAVLLVGVPVWWATGLELFIWPLVALGLLVSLLRNGRIELPLASRLWAGFLVLALASGIMLGGRSALAFAYYLAMYASAGIVFVWVHRYAADRRFREHVVLAGATLWVLIVLGGYLGLLAPDLGFDTPLNSMVPNSLHKGDIVARSLHVETTQIELLDGKLVKRPKAPFKYTNEWGANLALTTPFAIAALALLRRRRRIALITVGGAALLPVALSLNRGLWLSLGLITLYTALRSARRLVPVAIAAAVVIGALALSPLGGKVIDRIERPGNSVHDRGHLYEAAIRLTGESPLLGHGGTVRTADTIRPVGTHGQIWRILVSNGIPAAILFVSWLGLMAYRTRRGTGIAFWCHMVIVIALLEMWFYDFIPLCIQLLAIAGAIGLRAIEEAAPAPGLARADARGGA